MALTQVDGGLLSPTNGQFYSMKNRIINGAMVIDQRNAGAALSVTTGVYTIDRWVGASSGGTTTFQRIASGTTGFSNAIQIKPLTSVTLSSFYQRIESNNCQDLASATVTVSGQIYIDNASGVTCTLYIGIPSASDNYATTNYLTGQTITLTGGSYVSFSKTFSLTSSGSNGLEVNIQFSSAVGKTIQLTGVQLEKGSTATSFDYRPYGTELALCQRYLPAFSSDATSYRLPSAGICSSTTQGYITIMFPQTTRVPATGITISSASHFTIDLDGVSALTATAVAFSAYSSLNAARIQVNAASGMTTGYPFFLTINNSSGRIYFTGCEL